jgi:hypothetical protein
LQKPLQHVELEEQNRTSPFRVAWSAMQVPPVVPLVPLVLPELATHVCEVQS